MLRVINSVLVEGSPANGNAVYYIEGACVSADMSDFPTEGIATGSKIYAVDVAAWAFFNEESEKWVDSEGNELGGNNNNPVGPDGK